MHGIVPSLSHKLLHCSGMRNKLNPQIDTGDQMGSRDRTNFVERTGRIEEMDRSFDVEFWRIQPDTARFAAAWELVVHSFIIKGKDVSQLRLQRTIEQFERKES